MKKILFALLTVSIALASCNKKNEPENSDAPQNDETSGTIKDICGNTYKYVKIGSQYWMAENMRCNKYDTESERPNATIATTSESYSYAPYFINASDKSTWDDDCLYSESLTDTQIQKLGYLYNWAAAVGLETEADALAQVTEFNGKRQGICPNEWHIPTKAEWNVLKDYAGGQNIAGRKLKATSGWSNADGYLIPGVDAFGFAALPAASGNGNHVGCLGIVAYFWTATPGKKMTSSNKNDASYFYMYGDANELLDDGMSPTKNQSFSVRCVKDEYQMSKVNLSLDKTEISIQVKTNTTITATTNATDEIVWTTSNANIATIKIDGKKCTINGIAVGEVEIKAEVAGVEAVCKVKVLSKESPTDNEDSGSDENIYDDIKSITLNKSELQLAIGQSKTLVATVTNTSDIVVWAPIEWTVYDNIVNIRPGYGSDVNKIEITVTGVATGEAKIKASVAGKEAVCVVKVLPSDKVETPLVASTPGMFTVVFKVPELQCYSDLLIGFHSSSINDNDPVAMELDAPYEGWFKVVIPAEYTIGKLCPRQKSATTGTWGYRAMGYTIIEGEASDVVAGGDPAILLREGAISHTVYVEVRSWAKNPCDDIQGGVGIK